MRLYIAGLYASHFHLSGNLYNQASDAAKWCRSHIGWNLESYHYIKKGRYVDRLREDGVKIFLDSGAFSAWSLGSEITIEEYAEFLKDNSDIVEMASVLDAIGDPVGTFHNQEKLEKLGVAVLPCFHFGEPWDLCEYYVRNYDYITIGGMVPIPNQKLEPWLDELWSKVLVDKDGQSRIKIHGFGQTSRKLMQKYPWYSVDSSSWVQAASNGAINLLGIRGPIQISERSPKVKDFGQHYVTLPPAEKAIVDRELAEVGMEAKMCMEDYRNRWALNAYTFHHLGEVLGDDHWRKPFKAAQPLLF